MSTVGVLGANPSSGMSSFDMAMYSRTINNNSQRFKKTHNVICDFCKRKGHVNENYHKLIGYHTNFKSKKKVVLNVLNNKVQLIMLFVILDLKDMQLRVTEMKVMCRFNYKIWLWA